MGNAGAARETIDGRVVKGLVEANALAGASVIGQAGGFAVVVRYGDEERAIAAQRSRQIRLWRNLNTAAAYVQHELGVERFEVDMSYLDIAASDRSRPDTAERQRQLREAAEHDTWFRAEVQRTVDGVKDGTVRLIEEADWNQWLAEKKVSFDRRTKPDHG
jgi:hypothetical protein